MTVMYSRWSGLRLKVVSIAELVGEEESVSKVLIVGSVSEEGSVGGTGNDCDR